MQNRYRVLIGAMSLASALNSMIKKEISQSAKRCALFNLRQIEYIACVDAKPKQIN
jgi:hypothetical protein